MSKIYAVGYELTEADRRQIDIIIYGMFGVYPEIEDAKQCPDSMDDADLIVTFGEPAYLIYGPRGAVGVPVASKLIGRPENEEYRTWTFHTLSAARQKLDGTQKNVQGNLLSKDSLPRITADKVAEIEKQNPNGWICTAPDGKTVRVSAHSSDRGSEDIQLTYSELYALKVASELLGVTEFELVPSNKNHSNRGR